LGEYIPPVSKWGDKSEKNIKPLFTKEGLGEIANGENMYLFSNPPLSPFKKVGVKERALKKWEIKGAL
jgi:hypothetical protein